MKYYTYLWLREDGTPYYVGKGCGPRAFRKTGHSHARPTDKSLILVQEFPDENSALEAEKFLISYYGRKDLGTGCLRNLTDGGENPPLRGHLGHKHSPEAKAKMRLARLGKKLGPPTEATRKKIALSNTGKVRSLESREKQSKSCMGRVSWNLGKSNPRPPNAKMPVWTEEMREAARQRAQGNTNRRGSVLSQETRMKISVSKRHAAKAGA